MKSIKVSVIIPVYNVAPYLKECLDSIFGQTLQQIEVICINDGSTDESPDILTKYNTSYSNMSVLHQQNKGPSATRNRGIDHCQGEYIYFMDSDDKLELDALQTLYTTANENKLDVLLFDGATFYDDQANIANINEENYFRRTKEYSIITSGHDMFVQLKQENNYIVSVCLQLINREYLNTNKLRFYEGILHEDNLFTLQCLLTAGRSSHLRKVFFNRRVRSNSIMTQNHTFNHLYGYFVCHTQMQAFCQKLNLTHQTQAGVKNELANILHTMSEIYSNLPQKEKDKFNDLGAIDQYIISHLLDPESISAQTKSAMLLEQIYQSHSFRIARFITYIPRQLRKLAGSQ